MLISGTGDKTFGDSGKNDFSSLLTKKWVKKAWFGMVWLGCDQNWSERENRIQTASCSKFQSSSQTPGS